MQKLIGSTKRGTKVYQFTTQAPALKLHDAPRQTLSQRQLDAVTRNILARIAVGQTRDTAIREACSDLGHSVTDVKRYLGS
jgi:hypothetical protein